MIVLFVFVFVLFVLFFVLFFCFVFLFCFRLFPAFACAAVPLITNIKCAKLFVEALRTCETRPRAQQVDCQASHDVISIAAPVDCSIDIKDFSQAGAVPCRA